MTPSDRKLTRKLAWMLVVKLVALVLLWWLFVHDQRVEVDGDAAATQLLTPNPSPGGTHP